jgi:uncharacterized coiled-coil protein SlyX
MDSTKRADRQRRYLAGLRASRNEALALKGRIAGLEATMARTKPIIEALRLTIKNKDTEIRQLQLQVARNDAGDEQLEEVFRELDDLKFE